MEISNGVHITLTIAALKFLVPQTSAESLCDAKELRNGKLSAKTWSQPMVHRNRCRQQALDRGQDLKANLTEQLGAVVCP